MTKRAVLQCDGPDCSKRVESGSSTFEARDVPGWYSLDDAVSGLEHHFCSPQCLAAWADQQVHDAEELAMDTESEDWMR